MKVYKVDFFRRNQPRVSVVVPVMRGENNPNLSRLIEELKKQTFQDFELVVAEGVSPNGKARNEAVKQTEGERLVFIDETTSLGHDRVIENLMNAFSGKIAATGASVLIHPDSTGAQRQYSRIRGFDSAIVETPTESDKVQHCCMAISKDKYFQIGGESDRLETGTDDDLRQRLRAAGFSMVLAPKTWVYYTCPQTLREMLKKSFRKGQGSAYAFLIFPGLFESPRLGPIKFDRPLSRFIYKTLANLAKLFHPVFLLNPVSLLCEWAVYFGFVRGWLKWAGKDPIRSREDLPFRGKAGQS